MCLPDHVKRYVSYCGRREGRGSPNHCIVSLSPYILATIRSVSIVRKVSGEAGREGGVQLYNLESG